MKSRLDKAMVERGLVSSREKAQALILAGRVLVNEQKVEKAGASIAGDSAIRVLGNEQPFVSRGGLKLAKALEHWQIDVSEKICLDVGASTGGFTDCLLQNGAAEVVAVDTGYGQMDAKLRSDPRVHLLEKTNARYLTADQVWQARPPVPVGLIAMDVSFISATLVLPAVLDSVSSADTTSEPIHLVLLVKPQFEVGRELVGKGGIVRDPEAQQAAVQKVKDAVEQLGGVGVEVIDSPILGAEGNREFLLHATFDRSGRLGGTDARH